MNSTSLQQRHCSERATRRIIFSSFWGFPSYYASHPSCHALIRYDSCQPVAGKVHSAQISLQQNYPTPFRNSNDDDCNSKNNKNKERR
eukprot:1404464-Amphidinium_carterae.1